MEEIIVDIIGTVIAFIALIVSIVSICKSYNASEIANNLNKDANILTQGQVEIQIREMISAARYRYVEIGCKIVNSNCDKKEFLSFENAALEDYLNAYDEACAKYLDGKVDKERFRKIYFDEINNLFKKESTSKYLSELNPRYERITKVYKEWNLREN